MAGGRTLITGRLHSTPGESVNLDLYANSANSRTLPTPTGWKRSSPTRAARKPLNCWQPRARTRVGWTMTRYYQVRNALIDTPAGLAADLVTVNQLRCLREKRSVSASAGRKVCCCWPAPLHNFGKRQSQAAGGSVTPNPATASRSRT